MSRQTVQVACVAENQAHWYRRVENLAITLRTFGGRLASARFVGYFVGGVDPGQGALLRELGVELQSVPRYPAPKPTTNKLRMFEDFAQNGDADLLVALDCDTVIVGDFLDEASPGAVAAVAARTSPLDTDGWERLLGRLGLPEPPTSTIMFDTRQEVPAPYVNSGVLLVPRRHAEALATGWTMYVDRFVADSREGVREPWTGYFIDQIALACTLLERGIPVKVLGLHVNLATARNAAARRERKEALRAGTAERVKLLHYHKNITEEGRLLRSDRGSPLNELIDHVNRVIESRAGSRRRGVAHRLPGGARSLVARFLAGVSL